MLKNSFGFIWHIQFNYDMSFVFSLMILKSFKFGALKSLRLLLSLELFNLDLEILFLLLRGLRLTKRSRKLKKKTFFCGQSTEAPPLSLVYKRTFFCLKIAGIGF